MKKIIALLMTVTLLFTSQMAVLAEDEGNVKIEVTSINLTNEDPVEIEVTNVIMDNGKVTIVSGDRNMSFDGCKVFVGEEEIVFDQAPVVKDGVLYLPLRYTLEALGFEVTWNPETNSVDIMQGARFTSIKIGENAYFKNRMAPVALSGAPFIIDGRTMVPLEFFYHTLGESFTVDSNNIVFNSDMMGTFSGYVQSVEYDETGAAKITISSKEVSEDMMDLTIIHTNSSFTVFQKDVTEGSFVTVLTAPVMTMSIPAQTGGYIIY